MTWCSVRVGGSHLTKVAVLLADQPAAFVQAWAPAAQQALFQQSLHALRPGNQRFHLGQLSCCQHLPPFRCWGIGVEISEQAPDLVHGKARLLGKPDDSQPL